MSEVELLNTQTAQYAVGIDLGTTNSVIAFSPLADSTTQVELLEVPQLVAPGTVEVRAELPSFIFLYTMY